MSTISARFSRAKAWVFVHKAVSALVAVALLSGVYGTVKAAGTTTGTSNILGTVMTGDIVETVSGSGQIAAQNDVDVDAKASGAITGVDVKVGDEVSAGQQLATIDPGDAGLQLQEAKLAYQETVASKSASSQQAGNSVTESQQSLESAYTSARSAILSQNASLATSLDNLQTLLAQNGYLSGADAAAFATAQRSTAILGVQQAASDLAAFSGASETVTVDSDPATLQSVLQTGLTAANSVSIAAKDAETELDYLRQQTNNQNSSTDSSNAYSSVTSALSSADSALSSLQSAAQGITSAQDSLSETQTSASNTEQSSNDLTSAQLSLEDAQQAYDNYFVTSPIAGLVAKLNVDVGDQAGSGTTVATIITKQQVAQITLNEVDAVKVKVGDKATLTFDAIQGLTLTGTVAEVDLIGTVTQGVVSYGSKITLDTGDSRITSGMTVDADIITDSATNVLVVPSSAISTNGGVSMVKVVAGAPAASTSTTPTASASTVSSAEVTPQTVQVTTGLTDGTNTQILSGLTEGQTIVVRTQTTSAKTAAAAATTRTTGAAAGGAARAGGGFGGGAAGGLGAAARGI